MHLSPTLGTPSQGLPAAIAPWESGTAAEQEEIKDLLDALNNNDAVPFIHYIPREVSYG